MIIVLRVDLTRHRNIIKELLTKLVGDMLSMMGFFYYKMTETHNNSIYFHSDISNGTNNSKKFQLVIDKLNEWDGELTYNQIQRSQEDLTGIFSYINKLPVSMIQVIDDENLINDQVIKEIAQKYSCDKMLESKSDKSESCCKIKYIYCKRVNLHIKFFPDKIQQCHYDFVLKKKYNKVFYIEEVHQCLPDQLVKFELGFSIDPRNLYLTVMNKAHYLEHILLQQIRSKTDHIQQFNGFTNCIGFVNLYFVFEAQYFQEMERIIIDLLNEPIQQQDGVENIRLACETYTDEHTFKQKMNNVLTAQFLYSKDICDDKVDAKELNELFHQHYEMQYFAIMYSGNKNPEFDVDELLHIDLRHDTSKKNEPKMKSNEAVPEMELMQITLQSYPLVKDKEFQEFIRFADNSGIQFTINGGRIYIFNDIKYKLEYEVQRPSLRFIEINQCCTIDQELILLLQNHLKINKNNKFIKCINSNNNGNDESKKSKKSKKLKIQ